MNKEFDPTEVEVHSTPGSHILPVTWQKTAVERVGREHYNTGYRVKSEADHSCAMYSDRKEFDSSSKQTATPTFRPQLIRENNFSFRETPQNGS